MGFEAFIVSLISIIAAEFGDKTQLGVIALSARYREPKLILTGAMFAFFIVNGLGVLMGEGLLQVVPIWIVSKISGIIFIVMGIFMLRKEFVKNFRLNHIKSKSPLAAAFSLIFFSELGDKTQITTIMLAAK